MVDRTMKTKLVLLLAVLFSSCEPYVQTPNTPDPSGGPAECTKACANMQEASCEEGDPTPKRSTPCVQWCENYHKTGDMPPWSGCVADAGPDAQRIEACDMNCTRKEEDR